MKILFSINCFYNRKTEKIRAKNWLFGCKIIVLLVFFLTTYILDATAKMHDPTCPMTSPCYQESINPAFQSGIKIQSIIYSNTKKMVIINGQKLTIGDRINGFEIVNIFPDSISLKDKNQIVSVAMGYPDIKTSSIYKGN